MKTTQKAINSMFPAAKHYSQTNNNYDSQDKDYIVTTPTLASKQLLSSSKALSSKLSSKATNTAS